MDSSVKDPHYVDADPHSAFLFDAYPDTIFYYTRMRIWIQLFIKRMQICKYWPLTFHDPVAAYIECCSIV
jgi:hypothetical protein